MWQSMALICPQPRRVPWSVGGDARPNGPRVRVSEEGSGKCSTRIFLFSGYSIKSCLSLTSSVLWACRAHVPAPACSGRALVPRGVACHMHRCLSLFVLQRVPRSPFVRHEETGGGRFGGGRTFRPVHPLRSLVRRRLRIVVTAFGGSTAAARCLSLQRTSGFSAGRLKGSSGGFSGSPH